METTNETPANPSLKPLQVLIADDDEPTRMLLNAAISQWGYDVIEASNGEEAWKILEKKSIDLIISDWVMPKLNGIELCKRIRSELKYRPYIIMLTQIVGTSNIITGLDAGADEFLSKPFNIAELHIRMLVGIRILKYETKFIEQISRMEMTSTLAKETLVLVETYNKIGSQTQENQIAEFNHLLTLIKENLNKMIELGNL